MGSPLAHHLQPPPCSKGNSCQDIDSVLTKKKGRVCLHTVPWKSVSPFKSIQSSTNPLFCKDHGVSHQSTLGLCLTMPCSLTLIDSQTSLCLNFSTCGAWQHTTQNAKTGLIAVTDRTWASVMRCAGSHKARLPTVTVTCAEEQRMSSYRQVPAGSQDDVY